VRRDGDVDRVRANADGGAFVANARLRPGEAAVVTRFGIRDANGERNGAPSAVVTSGRVADAVLGRARGLAARGLPCGQPAAVPGPFRATGGADRRKDRDGARRVRDDGPAAGGGGDDDGGDLPFTGLQLAAVVLAALALLAGGALLRRLGRDAD
jgi:hypothetical protein